MNVNVLQCYINQNSATIILKKRLGHDVKSIRVVRLDNQNIFPRTKYFEAFLSLNKHYIIRFSLLLYISK